MTPDQLAFLKAIVEQNDSIIEQNFVILDAIFPMLIRINDEEVPPTLQ